MLLLKAKMFNPSVLHQKQQREDAETAEVGRETSTFESCRPMQAQFSVGLHTSVCVPVNWV